jgi:hypothetical protein
MSQLVVLYAMPGFFKSIADANFGTLPELALYGYWWLIGATVALAGVLLRNYSFGHGARLNRFGQHRAVVASLIMLAFASILAHACTSHWVYDAGWYPLTLSPVMLGLTVAIVVAGQAVGIGAERRLRLAATLPILAMLISAAFPRVLEFQPGALIVFSPLRLTMIGSSLVFAYAMFVWRNPLFGAGATTCLMTAGIGHSVPQIGTNIALIVQLFTDACDGLIPRSAAHWGLVSIVSAFVLLAAGVLLSLMKGRLEHAELRRYFDQLDAVPARKVITVSQ